MLKYPIVIGVALTVIVLSIPAFADSKADYLFYQEEKQKINAAQNNLYRIYQELKYWGGRLQSPKGLINADDTRRTEFMLFQEFDQRSEEAGYLLRNAEANDYARTMLTYEHNRIIELNNLVFELKLAAAQREENISE